MTERYIGPPGSALRLIPPITECFPMDLHTKEVSARRAGDQALNLGDLIKFEYVAAFGRPA